MERNDVILSNYMKIEEEMREVSKEPIETKKVKHALLREGVHIVYWSSLGELQDEW